MTHLILSLLVLVCGVSAFAQPKKDCKEQLIVTRFAPSPTGALHIGGVRTALFNWMHAKKTAGKFLLRIEDTDRERSRQEHIDSILSSLRWMGLEWDGDPVIQSTRSERHIEVAKQLLNEGKAYYCYLTPEELERMRKSGHTKIVSPWRDKNPKEAPKGVKPVIRLKADTEGETIVEDLVQGNTRFANEKMDDLILVRSDGTPTYNFAVVIDDHDMGVTNVIRGVDHLTNTARQMQIYKALGWEAPAFAHVPLINGEDGRKLSKREGAQGANDYRQMGYLPETLLNHLSRLGWAHRDDEIFTAEQAIQWFELKDIGRSPSQLNIPKLNSLNRHYIRQSSDDRLIQLLRDEYLSEKAKAKLEKNNGWKKLAALMPELKKRADTLVQLMARASFLWDVPKVTDKRALQVQKELFPRLSKLTTWDQAAVEVEIRAYAAEAKLERYAVLRGARLALTGSEVGVPIYDLILALGR